ncbi:S-adenosyl-L-methionine-dependent methyltransferase [Xylariomycetidae sp. FL0641]|nr:S-adenosyl-L-methionine-dependent methyltransferase [Xylariomycetidae sp. FL0641]
MDASDFDQNLFGVPPCANLPLPPADAPASAASAAPEPFDKTITIELPQSTLTQPRALYDGFVAPAKEASEAKALEFLLRLVKTSPTEPEDFLEFDLNEFTVYIDGPIYPNELRPLQSLTTRMMADVFYFDGILSSGDTQFYLRKVPFRQLPVGNYGSEVHSVEDQIWIQSKLNDKKAIYYKLGTPSPEYARFYSPFLWIADLAKHTIDYCHYLQSKGRRATLHDFKSRFNDWVWRKHHTSSKVFREWHAANRGSDFRSAVSVNAGYIYKEAYGLDSKLVSRHPLWKEIQTLDKYKPNLDSTSCLSSDLDDDETSRAKVALKKGPVPIPKTIVTPYIHDLFGHMVFGNVLEAEDLGIGIQTKQSWLLQHRKSSMQDPTRTVKRSAVDRDEFIASIQPGDVISTMPDDHSTTTQWKQEQSKHHKGEHLWFGLIQKVHNLSKGRRSFDVIWMYQSIDTPCSVLKYPWANELFLSDNCTCHHSTAKVKSEQVLATHEVEWFGDESTSAEYFVRQTYVATESLWTTLRKEHLVCAGSEPQPKPSELYKPGDAVLVQTKESANGLDPFIVEDFLEEGTKEYVRLRRLLRRRDVDQNAPNTPMNELVFSHQLVETVSKRIHRRCLVRAFYPGEKITSPYDRQGTGDAFYITHLEEQNDPEGIVYVLLHPPHAIELLQDFKPHQVPNAKKLRGLDLFCGGGNFGRGLEDGGAVEMRWANDIWGNAIHSYMANCEPGSCKPFLGSCDDLLLRAIRGDRTSNVPTPGDVDFISGGSPCPGFSILTMDKTTPAQRKNQSLVASFASFIDLYRPLYGLLENVPAMVNSKKFRDACVFSQLVCAIVGLGYQVQIMRLDAWSHGAPQSRSRVFLSFTAAGLRMPKIPKPTHSHPEGTPLHRLGDTSCGRPFDVREDVPTPFKFVDAWSAVSDLPDIQDGKADYCVGFPYHRLPIGFTPPIRKQVRQIPTQPFAMNFSKAYYGHGRMRPVMTESERELFPKAQSERISQRSRGWGRVHPKGVFNTISTTIQPTDARTGTFSHWQQHRPISILEARRAQGFLDHEIIVGSVLNQWRIIGNSVARQVALALGLVLREAWYDSLQDVDPTTHSQHRLSADDATQSVEAVDEDQATDPVFSPKVMNTDTPATMGSCEESDVEVKRKRASEICIEILSKRAKLTISESVSNGSASR